MSIKHSQFTGQECFLTKPKAADARHSMSPGPVASVSVPKDKFKTAKRRLHTIQFYGVLFLLIFVASLPTGFFIFHQSWHQIQQKDNKNRSVSFASDLGKPVASVVEHAYSLDNNSIPMTNLSSAEPRCNAPLVRDRFNQCSLACDWTSMSPMTYRMYYGLMVVGFWIAVIAAVVSMVTWSKIASLRKFPHNVRFYLIVCCIILGCCKMLPLRIGLKKVFCHDTDYWTPLGHSSLYTLIQGATCHYFSLVNCAWATCFVANTYTVVVRDNRTLFEHSVIVHICQSLVCWLLPAIIVASCIYAKWPAPLYTMTFIDWMSAMPSDETISYVSVTLPMQLTLGVSLCLLWSITWYLRKSRLDTTRHTIRADEDTQSMQRIERQFLSMAVMILLVLGAVLSVTTTIGYNQEVMVQRTMSYINCLKHSSSCQAADLWIPLFAVTMLAPGFLCIVFFFLLFMNKECRQIWSGCFQRLTRVTTLCLPVTNAETKSRCSSTLTVLSERRLSDFALRDVIKTPETKLRASSALCVNSTRLSPCVPRHVLSVDSRPRSSSTPERFLTTNRDREADAFVTSYNVVSVPQENSAQPEPPRHFNVEIELVDDGIQDSIKLGDWPKNSHVSGNDVISTSALPGSALQDNVDSAYRSDGDIEVENTNDSSEATLSEDSIGNLDNAHHGFALHETYLARVTSCSTRL